jgi:hypothetical protein
VSGIKRHIEVDTQRTPHAIPMTAAEATDRSVTLLAIDRCRPNLKRIESLLADGGYTGQKFADGVKDRLEPPSMPSCAIYYKFLPCRPNAGPSNAPSNG